MKSYLFFPLGAVLENDRRRDETDFATVNNNSHIKKYDGGLCQSPVVPVIEKKFTSPIFF